MTVYISVDIEASGPFPPDYSMLSVGAVVVVNPSVKFYRELKPISDNFTKEALEVSGFTMEQAKEKGKDPATAMEEFADWVEKLSNRGKPKFVGYPACHSQDTKTIVAGKGIVSYTEVNIGDKVYGIDENGDVVWTTVRNVFVYDYAGEMYDISGKSASFLVTPEHRVMLSNGTYVRACELGKNEYIKIPRARLGSRRSNRRFRASADVMTKYPLPALVGWYTAEGYCRDHDWVILCLNNKDLTYVKPILESKTLKQFEGIDVDCKAYIGQKLTIAVKW